MVTLTRRAIPAVTLVVSLLWALPAFAATTLTAEIVSWQVVGVDSNDPAGSAPELFIVQAKITNTGGETAINASSTLSLGALVPNPCAPVACISIVSSAVDSLGSIAPGATVDAYWTVRVAKTAAAFDTITPITVTAVADNAPVVTATQAPRVPAPCGNTDTPGGVLLVENLISQARNDVLSYTVSPGLQRPDGSWEVVAGSTFTVTVIAKTATIYDEISVPAIIDPLGKITPIRTSFSYEEGTPSDDDIYTLSAGGIVTARYTYAASSLGSVELSQLIYDCSGNSFHYNSDYLSDFVTIHVVAAPSEPLMTLSKTASPATVEPGQRVTFTIAYRNDGMAPATGFVIRDEVDVNLTGVEPSDGGIFDPATRIITWDIGTVPGSSSGSVSFSAVVSDFAGGLTVTNVATATGDGLDPVASPPVTLEIPPTIPVTGLPTWLLFLLGWSSIGFGAVLADRYIPTF